MGRLRLLLGIFLLFTPAALIHDLAFRRPVPFYRAAWWSIGIGLAAVASAEILARPRRLVWMMALAREVHDTLVPPVSYESATLECYGLSQPTSGGGAT